MTDRASDDAVATQVRRLADEADIRRVLAVFCQRLDEYDIDAVVALFAEDCRLVRGVVDGAGSGEGCPFVPTAIGRQAVHALIANNQARYCRTHHQIGNVVIEIDGGEADCVSNAICWHREHDGNTVVVWLRYVDRFVRHHGTWQIAERRLLVQGIDGSGPLAEGPWEWVPRHSP